MMWGLRLGIGGVELSLHMAMGLGQVTFPRVHQSPCVWSKDNNPCHIILRNI